MRILRNARVNALHNEYQKQGMARCPQCGAPLQILFTPKFSTSGRVSCSTFSVVCENCGVSGAVEKKFLPKTA